MLLATETSSLQAKYLNVNFLETHTQKKKQKNRNDEIFTEYVHDLFIITRNTQVARNPGSPRRGKTNPTHSQHRIH